MAPTSERRDGFRVQVGHGNLQDASSSSLAVTTTSTTRSTAPLGADAAAMKAVATPAAAGDGGSPHDGVAADHESQASRCSNHSSRKTSNTTGNTNMNSTAPAKGHEHTNLAKWHQRRQSTRLQRRPIAASTNGDNGPSSMPNKARGSSSTSITSSVASSATSQPQPPSATQQNHPARFSKTRFLTGCRQHVYSMDELQILNMLNTPIWIFDGVYKTMRFGNQAACTFWSATHMDELLARDYASDMSETTDRSNFAWLQRFRKHPTSEDKLMWTFQPTHGKNAGPRFCDMTISGIYIPHPDNPQEPHLCLLVVAEAVRSSKVAGTTAATVAEKVQKKEEGSIGDKKKDNDIQKDAATSVAADVNADPNKATPATEATSPSSDKTAQDGNSSSSVPKPDTAASQAQQQHHHHRSKKHKQHEHDDPGATSLRRMETLRHLPVVARRFDLSGTLMDQNPEAFALFGEPSEKDPDSETNMGSSSEENPEHPDDAKPLHDDDDDDDDDEHDDEHEHEHKNTQDDMDQRTPGLQQEVSSDQHRHHRPERRRRRRRRRRHTSKISSDDDGADSSAVVKGGDASRKSSPSDMVPSEDDHHAEHQKVVSSTDRSSVSSSSSTTSSRSSFSSCDSTSSSVIDNDDSKHGNNENQQTATIPTDHDDNTAISTPIMANSKKNNQIDTGTNTNTNNNSNPQEENINVVGGNDDQSDDISDIGIEEEMDDDDDDEPPCCDFVAQFVDHEKGRQVLQKVVESKGLHDVGDEAQLETVDGPKWFSIKIRLVKDPVTTQWVMIYSARDISDIMQAAKDEADRQNMKKSEFFAVMAHEIRTPLHQVVGFIELLASTPLNIEQADFVNMLQSSTNALMAIINDLLDFTKLEAGKMKLENIPFEVRNVMDGSVAAVSPQAEEKGLQVHSNINCGIPVKLVGDPNRLRQIILNMLTNAIKFTSHGHITTSVELISEMSDPVEDSDSGDGGGGELTGKIVLGGARCGVSGRTGKSSNQDGDGNTSTQQPRKRSSTPSRRSSMNNNNGNGSKNRKSATATSSVKPKVTDEQQVILRFTVQDTGIGMTDDQCSRIFNAYQQADASVARNFGGTGLGLAICKSLVKSMGGVIGVNSVAGEGTAFWFEVAYKRHTPIRSVTCNGVDGIINGSAEYPNSELQSKLKLDGKVLIDLEHGNGVRENGGTTAVVRVDGAASAAPQHGHAIDHDGQPPANATTTVTTTTKECLQVLVAEDNKVNQKVIRNMLQRLGHEVTIVENGEMAVARVCGGDGGDGTTTTTTAPLTTRERRFDIVLMDWQMPVMDGIDATKEIRTRGISELDLPIVGLTASIQAIDWQRIGMNDCLKKPVRIADLKESLAKNAIWGEQ